MSRGKFFQRLAECTQSRSPVALVTVIETVGSAPREAGAKMLVFPDGRIEGTIGGGLLEALAAQEAVIAIANGIPVRKRFNLGARSPLGIGMFCGGEVEVFIDVIGREHRLVIAGGGHVGQALARVAAAAGMAHVVADDRPQFASAALFPQAARIVVAPLPGALDQFEVDDRSYVVIVSRCHTVDTECLAWALGSTAAYIGLIGSQTKIRHVFKILDQRGLHPQDDARVYAPIGLDIALNTPGEVATSILAEVLAVKNASTPRHRRLEAGGRRLEAGLRSLEAGVQGPEAGGQASRAAGRPDLRTPDSGLQPPGGAGARRPTD